MIQKLAEQIERLAGSEASDEALTSDVGNRVDRTAVEEDQTPQDAPADPMNDRT